MPISITYTFTPGTTILSAQVNSNFSTLSTNAVNVTGDTMTGTLTTRALTPSTTATYDIGGSSAKYVNAYFSGTVTTSAVSASAGVTAATVTTSTVTASTLAVTNAGTITASTLTAASVTTSTVTASTVTASGALTGGSVVVNSNTIVNTSGTIPAISSTYFASLSGANLTSLNGSNVSSGTVAAARLPATTAYTDAAQSFTAAQTMSAGLLGSIGTTTVGSSGNVNNLSLGNATYLVVTANAGGNAITGIAGGAAGRILFLQIFNSGGTNTITDQDTNSSAGNRFAVGATKTFAQAGAGLFVHDGTFWRPIAYNSAVS